MEARTGERFEALDVGIARVVQHAGGGDDDVDLVAVTARGIEPPAAVRERARGDFVAEPHVADDVVVARNPLEVAVDLGPGRVAVAPLRCEREGVRVEMRRHVARETGIRVLAPRAAQAITLLVHGEVGESGFVELDGAEDAGHAGADDCEAHQGILEHASIAASTAVRVASLASSAIWASSGTRSGCSFM